MGTESQDKPSKGSYGHHDGVHSIVWKADMSTDQENLIQPGILQNELSIGHLLVFPQWIPVSTFPFEGDGDRKWVSANVALLDVPLEPEQFGIGPCIMSMGSLPGDGTQGE